MQATKAKPVSYNGQSDGTIKAGSVTAGNSNYQCSKDATTFQTFNSFSGLASGTYTITLKDAKGCTETSSVEVIQPAELTMKAATTTPVICNGKSDGTMTKK